MNFAFDIDGTISAAPEAYAALIAALLADGHQCHILTGTGDPVATPEHYSHREEQLRSFGIEKWTALRIVTSPGNIQAKAEYCKDHDIAMMFEDSAAYADAIRHVSTCLMMCPSD